jgi:hypothetical protein
MCKYSTYNVVLSCIIDQFVNFSFKKKDEMSIMGI